MVNEVIYRNYSIHTDKHPPKEVLCPVHVHVGNMWQTYSNLKDQKGLMASGAETTTTVIATSIGG